MNLKPDPPTPTDPRATAAGQTGTNVATAVANALMGNVNQYTPQGSLTFSQGDPYTWTDPFTGSTYTIPTFSATQVYSPQQQAIFDQQQAANFNIAGMANQQSAMLGAHLAGSFDPTAGAPFRPDVTMLWGDPARYNFADAGKPQSSVNLQTEFGDA